MRRHFVASGCRLALVLLPVGLPLVMVSACEAPAAVQRDRLAPAPPATAGLFRPEALGLLEDPDRDEWQQPDRVMDDLHIADGSRVGDVGAGGGWFTTRLSRRVGPNGVVYAEDVQAQMVESIRQRARQEGLANVHPILSSPADPLLPSGLDAVLLVDAYGQLSQPMDLMRHVVSSLAPNGRFGIVDFKPGGSGGPGPPSEQRVAAETIVADAARAGLVVRSRDDSLRYQYVLVLGR
jgi:predicted methyltransferase